MMRPLYTSIGILTLLTVTAVVLSAPRTFPMGEIIIIEDDQTVDAIAEHLAEENVIRSATLFEIAARVGHVDTRLRSGSYVFQSPRGMLSVLSSVVRGVSDISHTRIRIPEGATREDIAAIMSDALPEFNKDIFLAITKEKEGHLFPDTYFLPLHANERTVAEILEETFNQKIDPLRDDIQTVDLSLKEVIILASIVEKEVYKPDDQKKVAGVLWNRLNLDMPLQVDAPFVYSIGKGSHELTRDDLATDSPYNTYTRRGLPPTAIGNPGLGAIEAVLNPTQTDYFFYLSDETGMTHYAETFEEHKENRRSHLDS